MTAHSIIVHVIMVHLRSILDSTAFMHYVFDSVDICMKLAGVRGTRAYAAFIFLVLLVCGAASSKLP